MNNNRALIPCEIAMEIGNRCGGLLNVVVVNRIKGELSEAAVRRSLDLLQHRHPYLNYRIVTARDRLHFTTAGTQKIPLSVIPESADRTWQDIVTQELNTPLESDRYLLRYTLLRDCTRSNINYLIATFHHAITDGLSCTAIQADLLKYCQGNATKASLDRLKLVPPVSALLPPEMKGFLGSINSLLFLLKLQCQIWLYRAEALETEKLVPLKSRRCGFVSKGLEKDLTQKLVALCKQEKTTVQGALCAAITLAVADKIRKGEVREVRISCRSFVDLRQRLQPVVPRDRLGIFASFLTSFHTLTPQLSFWDLAREVTQQLKQGLQRKEMFKPLMFSNRIIQRAIANADEASAATGITNVGRIDIPNIYGELELEDITFIPSNPIFSGGLVASVSTFEGKMTVNFLTSQPAMSQQMLEMLASRTMAYLVATCEGETPQFNRPSASIA